MLTSVYPPKKADASAACGPITARRLIWGESGSDPSFFRSTIDSRAERSERSRPGPPHTVRRSSSPCSAKGSSNRPMRNFAVSTRRTASSSAETRPLPSGTGPAVPHRTRRRSAAPRRARPAGSGARPAAAIRTHAARGTHLKRHCNRSRTRRKSPSPRAAGREGWRATL